MKLDWITIVAIVVIVAGLLYLVMKRRKSA
ncbi:MAG TPA: LPXTG cell wall anchor domain-containing protein [Pyrinomonadaceae bacterium]